MQIEVLYHVEENGEKILRSETLSEYGDIDGAVRSVEDRISRGRNITILGTIVHNPRKVEKISEIVRRQYAQNRYEALTQAKKA